jgi:poly(hydroxyalkanoate) granule-associated protein
MAKKKTDPIEELKTSAERVWLAGLGALAEAEKRGDKLFKDLVKKGKHFEEKFPDPSESLKGGVESARKQATLAWKDFESVFDEKVQGAMSRMGVAQQSDVDALKKEIAALKKSKKKSAKGKSSKKTKEAKRTKKTGSTAATAKKKAAKRPSSGRG